MHDGDVTLRPLLPYRVLASMPGLVALLVAALAVDGAPSWRWGVVGVLAPVGVWLMARGYRSAVVCAGTTIIVRGLLRDRTIPCDAETRVGEFPLLAINWRDAKGRERATPITAFWSGQKVPAHHQSELNRLRRHVQNAQHRVQRLHHR